MSRPYNRNTQIENDPKLYSVKDSIGWVSERLGKRSRSWLYKKIDALGIEVKKNGKATYLYEADLKKISAVETLSQLALKNNRS